MSFKFSSDELGRNPRPRIYRACWVSMIVLSAVVPTRSAASITTIGGIAVNGPPAVRHYDVSDAAFPIVLDRTEDLPAAASFVEVHDGLFVAGGFQLRQYKRGHWRDSPVAVWDSGSPIVAVADGPQRGLVLVLSRTELTAVRFSDSATPIAMWTYAIDGGAPTTGRSGVLVRSGNYVYVADASLPGVRVLDIDSTESPTSLAVYESPEGPVHDLALWGTTLSLVTDTAMVVVDIASIEKPVFTRLGSYSTMSDGARVDTNSRYAFLADGANLLLLDIDPASPDFLGAPIDFWVAPFPIRSVRLDRGQRAYVLVEDAWEALDIQGYGGK